MKLAAAVFPALSAATVVSSGLSYSGNAACGMSNTAVCLSLKADLPKLGLIVEKFSSLAERNKACASSLPLGCVMTLSGKIVVNGDSLCTDVIGYNIGDHLLQKEWVVDKRIESTQDLTACKSTKAYYASVNSGLCTTPTNGVEATLSIAADAIAIGDGNPAAELVIPGCSPVEGTTFTLTVSQASDSSGNGSPDAASASFVMAGALVAVMATLA